MTNFTDRTYFSLQYRRKGSASKWTLIGFGCKNEAQALADKHDHEQAQPEIEYRVVRVHETVTVV